MARCGCSGASCGCVIRGIGAVSVSGAGTVNSPYIIDSNLYVAAGAEGTVALTIEGDGSLGNPYVFNASQEMWLGDLYDVNTSGGLTGYVLARQADGTYALAPPSTAAVGAISTDDSISGDGSSGAPLSVALAAGGGLVSTPTGLAASGAAEWAAYTPVVTTSNGSTITKDPATILSGRYIRVGDTVHFSLNFKASLAWPASSGFYLFSLPVPAAGSTNDRSTFVVRAELGPNQGDIFMGTGSCEGGSYINRTTLQTMSGSRHVGSTYPNWGSFAHRIQISGTYQAA